MMRFSERIYKQILVALTLVFSMALTSRASIHEGGDAAKGEQLFKANCASCHKITNEVVAAPGLAGVSDRWAGKDALLVKWVQNPQAAAATGDAYIKGLVATNVPLFGWMAGQAVTEADIKDIMTYIKTPPASAAGAGAAPTNECQTLEELKADAEKNEEHDGFIWFIIIGVILAIIGVSAANINRSLKNAINEREGLPVEPEVGYWITAKSWMWKNRVFVAVIGLFLFCYVGVVGYSALMNIGVYEGYTPTQDVWFSHSIHVCQNEIDCQYCHSSAANSKHAGIPSVNVCMNCHKGIKEGKITGTSQINKIYAAIGFDPAKGTYIEGAEQKPLVWNKVHNLPDHVYFNHSQHVTVGKIDCKQCHGPVDKYTVGHQATIDEINAQDPASVPGLIKLTKPTLTMGWCLECHNKSQVDLTSSAYYEEMHKRFETSEVGLRTIRDIMEDGEVTVREMGGWECGKCHY